MYGTILHPAISPKIKIGTAAIIINFIVKHHVLRTYQCTVLHENIKHYQNTCFPNETVTSSTVTSSKLNDENSAKARYFDETHSYRFLKFEINK